MNRPSQKYTFLADKHYDSNPKVLRMFAKEVLKELENNPDGVQLPLAFLQIVRKYSPSNNITVRRKYGDNYKFPNSNTDGAVITTELIPVSNIYTKSALNNTFNYSVLFINLFKTEWYKPLKKIQYRIANSLDYLKFKES